MLHIKHDLYTEYVQKKGVKKFINWWFDFEFDQQKIEKRIQSL